MNSTRVYTAEGIILKKRAVGEADRLLTVFTKQYGKIRVIAKGVRKISSRRAGHLEVFSRVVLTLHASKQWDIVTEAQSISRGTSFDGDLGRMGFAYCLCELVDQLTPDRQEQRDVYELLATSLDVLVAKNSPDEWGGILSHFIHELLWMLGYLPRERLLAPERMKPFVESITERKLRAFQFLGSMHHESRSA